MADVSVATQIQYHISTEMHAHFRLYFFLLLLMLNVAKSANIKYDGNFSSLCGFFYSVKVSILNVVIKINLCSLFFAKLNYVVIIIVEKY